MKFDDALILTKAEMNHNGNIDNVTGLIDYNFSSP